MNEPRVTQTKRNGRGGCKKQVTDTVDNPSVRVDENMNKSLEREDDGSRMNDQLSQKVTVRMCWIADGIVGFVPSRSIRCYHLWCQLRIAQLFIQIPQPRCFACGFCESDVFGFGGWLCDCGLFFGSPRNRPLWGHEDISRCWLHVILISGCGVCEAIEMIWIISSNGRRFWIGNPVAFGSSEITKYPL